MAPPLMLRFAQQVVYVAKVRCIPARRTGLFRQAIRSYASAPANSPPSGVPIDPILSPAAPPSAPRSKSTRYVRTMITVLSFFLLGSLSGTLVTGILVPPPLSIPDSEEDAALMSKLKRDLSALPLVKELRSTERKSEGWIEYEAFMGLPDEIRDQTMTAGTLRGTRGIGLRRMWWNSKKKELIGVIFFGGGVAGWPGVVHGGALATVLLEGIATVGNGGPREIRGLMSTSEDAEKEMVREFGIRYLKPTNANRLFMIRAGFEQDDDQLIKCWLEDIQKESITVMATGKVRVPGVIALGAGDLIHSEGLLGRWTKGIFG